MQMTFKFFLRWMLATLIVAVPSAYLFWEWRYAENPVLPALSYQSVNETLGGETPSVFWSYALWVIVALLAINLSTLLIAWLLGRFFPDPNRVEKA